jgi:hypothetical protein
MNITLIGSEIPFADYALANCDGASDDDAFIIGGAFVALATAMERGGCHALVAHAGRLTEFPAAHIMARGNAILDAAAVATAP